MKKNVIFISFALLMIVLAGLYNTFATEETIENDNDTYNMVLNNDSVVDINGNSSKIVTYQIKNTNRGTVRYGVGYQTDNNDISVKVFYDSIDPVTGLIKYNENKYVKLKINNQGDSTASITLKTVLGYENDENLIPIDSTLVRGVVEEYSSLMEVIEEETEESIFLNTNIKRKDISSIVFTEDNIVPYGYNNVYDISKDSNGSILLWYGEINDKGLYDIYIGSESKKILLTNGYYLFSNLVNVSYLDFSNIYTYDVTNMESMFLNLGSNESITDIKLIGIDKFDTSKVFNMNNMFSGIGSITSDIDLSAWNVDEVIEHKEFNSNNKIINPNWVK